MSQQDDLGATPPPDSPPAVPSEPPKDTKEENPEHIVSVAPGNTHADEPYLGTDPVYQNHANDTEAPMEVEVDDDADEATVRSAYLEETAYKNAEEAEKAGLSLGVQGFTVPSLPEPPRTVEEVRAYEEDKAQRMAAARAEAAKHPATSP